MVLGGCSVCLLEIGSKTGRRLAVSARAHSLASRRRALLLTPVSLVSQTVPS